MLIVIWQLYILFMLYEFIYNFIVRLSKPYYYAIYMFSYRVYPI